MYVFHLWVQLIFAKHICNGIRAEKWRIFALARRYSFLSVQSWCFLSSNRRNEYSKSQFITQKNNITPPTEAHHDTNRNHMGQAPADQNHRTGRFPRRPVPSPIRTHAVQRSGTAGEQRLHRQAGCGSGLGLREGARRFFPLLPDKSPNHRHRI